MKQKEDELMVYVPRLQRRLKLTRRGTLFDALLVTFVFALCTVASLYLVYPTQFTNFLKWFHCNSNQSVKPTTNSAVDKIGAPQCGVTFDYDRFDCWPESSGASQGSCEARGCCWDTGVAPGIPTCYYPRDFTNTYTVTTSRNTSTGLTATLTRSSKSPYPDDVTELSLEVTFETNQRLRFKIYDSKNPRYQVPIDLQKEPISAPDPEYSVTLRNDPFSITVRRRSNGQMLFDSTGLSPLIFADQFLQIGTRLATTNIYGLGEHRTSFRLNTWWTKIVFWARDQAPTLKENLYGSHPFFMNLDGQNNAHGVFLLNSNAMEVDIQPYSGSAALTYRSIGGILDFYIFTGPSPDDVVRQYVSLIGKPFLPPFWSLGFHLCKYGYMTAAELKKVIDRNRAAEIPYDVQWNDIDYMAAHLDWTYDNTWYAGLPDIVEDLHKNNQKYIIIVDPGISNGKVPGSYPPYDEGLADDVFVKAYDGSYLVGKVWPGNTVFPDFFHPKAEDWWFRQAKRYHDDVPFDGLWTDMNEPSNFVEGSLSGCSNNSFDKPPFVPPTLDGVKLESKTICPSATHNVSWHYNVHSLYGFSEQRASMNVLKKLRDKRSITISRSTFPSSGRYGGHWLGDNRSGWPDLYYSIPGILNFQMFGVSLVGADICGFGGGTTPELCTRWTQLGAFYPFMRNHDALGQKDQDPGAFDPTTRDIMKSAIETRYTLLPYLYTLFYRNNVEGTPIARPLFFQYPGQAPAQDTQFLWGSALLITPTLEEGATSVSAYIPIDIWYDFYNGSRLMAAGSGVILDSPFTKINLHVRGGSVIPTKPSAVTTFDLRALPISLLVALSADGSASGEVFWDDGESLDTVEQNKYSLVTFSVVNKRLTNKIIASNYNKGKEMELAMVTIYGVATKPDSGSVRVNNVTATSEYDGQSKTLIIFGLAVDLLMPLAVSW